MKQTWKKIEPGLFAFIVLVPGIFLWVDGLKNVIGNEELIDSFRTFIILYGFICLLWIISISKRESDNFKEKLNIEREDYQNMIKHLEKYYENELRIQSEHFELIKSGEAKDYYKSHEYKNLKKEFKDSLDKIIKNNNKKGV